AILAGALVAMLLETLPKREVRSLLFELWHIRRRRRRRFGDDLPSEPCPALHRIRLAAIRQSRENRRLCEHAAEVRPAVLDRDEIHAALGFLNQVVVGSHGFIGDDDVRLHQVSHRQVMPYQILYKLDRLLLQVIAREEGQPGELLTIDFHHVEFVEAQPLRRELIREAREPRVFNHPPHLSIQLGLERAVGRELQRLAIGGAVPQEVRELGRQLVAIERLGSGRLARLYQEQELRRGQNYEQRVLHARSEGATGRG